MNERNICIEKVREETREKMINTIVNPSNVSYRAAIKNLII